MMVAIVTLAVALTGAVAALVWSMRGWHKTKDTLLDERVAKTVARLDLATMTDAARRQKERADGLDALFQSMAAVDAAGGDANPREWVLAYYRLQHARAGGDGDGAVPASADADGDAGVDRDGLLRPGE